MPFLLPIMCINRFALRFLLGGSTFVRHPLARKRNLSHILGNKRSDNVHKPLCFAFFARGQYPLYGTHSQENAIYLTSSAINGAIMRINRFDFLKTLIEKIILLIFSGNDSTISLSLMKEMILWLIYIRSSRLLHLTA